MRDNRVHTIINWMRSNRPLLLLNSFLLGFILVMAWIRPVDRLKNYTIQRQTGNTASSLLLYGEESLMQTFVCKEDADSFEIHVSAANNSYHGNYQVSLCDKQGNRIQNWTTEKLDLTEGWIGYTLDHKRMKEGKIYQIVVSAPHLEKANAIRISLGSQQERYSETDQPSYEEGQLMVDGKCVDKTLYFGVYQDEKNVYFWMAVIVLFLTVNFWWGGVTKDQPIEKTALWILTGLGMIMFLCFTPASGPDEGYHYYSAYEISNVILGKEDIGEVDPKHIPYFSIHDNTNEKFVYVMEHIFGPGEIFDDETSDHEKLDDAAEETAKKKGQTLERNGHRDRLGSPISHLAPALGITIARLLDMNVVQIYTLARLFSLLSYILTASIAVRITPGNKELMLMICIMPMTLHQAVQISYDVIINGLVLVFTAYILKIIHDGKTVGWGNAFLCVLLLGLLGPVKVVYCILALLFTVIPSEQFQSGKDRIAKSCTVILGTFAIVMISKWEDLLPNLAGSSKRIIADNYALSFVFEHPIRFIKLIVRTIENSWWTYTKGAVGDSLAGLRVTVPEYLVIGFMILLILCAVNQDKESIRFSTRQKIVILCVCLTGIVFTVSAAFPWNSYGAYYVAGVQGRYLIPFLIPLPFCISGGKLTSSINRKKLLLPMWFLEAGYIISIMSKVEF